VRDVADDRAVHLLSTETLDERVSAAGGCRGMDTEAWYPPVHIGKGSVTAQTLRTERRYAAAQCSGCPVTGECLELALRIPAGQYGIWGATSERDRRSLRRERVAETTVAAEDGAA
jgi:hypothetical protein